MIQVIKEVFSNKCPVCGMGKVFKKQNPFLKMPKMNDSCSHCNHKFMKEPGFFFGAMYVSYALGVIEALVTYFIASYIFNTFFSLKVFIAITVVVVALTFYNLRLSRLIWIYIFKPKQVVDKK